MLQRKDAGKAGRRGALDHRSRRRAVYCAIICTPCRRNTHSRGEHGAAARGAALLESELGDSWIAAAIQRLFSFLHHS